jgi:hypothetical protein
VADIYVFTLKIPGNKEFFVALAANLLYPFCIGGLQNEANSLTDN